jgi:hypothetical protein
MTRRRTRLIAAAGAAALLLLPAGCGESEGQVAGVTSTAATRTPERPAKGLDAVRGFRSVRGYRATPVPVRLEIARIGVSSGLEQLGRAKDKTVQEPTDWDVAGWYKSGPRPGEPGSAVLVGHVDSTRGPAVFYRLRELRPGDKVEVVRADGSRVRFSVDRVEQYSKRRFPTDEVYYPTLRPALRLVTCGGRFNQATHRYEDNVIAFASLSG